jgi:hypothetical protein
MTNLSETSCEAAREPKYVELSRIIEQLTDIIQHIENVNAKLGVNRAPTPVEKLPEMPSLDSLVNVLDHLPTMVNGKVQQIHGLLNDLEQSLT